MQVVVFLQLQHVLQIFDDIKNFGNMELCGTTCPVGHLQCVGNFYSNRCPNLEVDFTPQAIEERYRRFGGIIRYVLPNNKQRLAEAEHEQSSVLSRTNVADIFAPYKSIEKTDRRDRETPEDAERRRCRDGVYETAKSRDDSGAEEN